MIKLRLLFLFFIGTAGCVFKPAPALSRFPIGLQAVPRPEHLKELKAAGFDSFVPFGASLETLSEMAKEARRLHLRMLPAPDDLNSLRKAPAGTSDAWSIDAWYIRDEPDVTKMPPSELEVLSQDVRNWDPKRPQYLNVGQGSAAEAYGKIADIFSVDWYPVPHLKLDSVADQMEEAKKHLPPGKTLWMILQAFDWRDSPQKDPNKPRIGRFPTHREMRFMTYLSIVHGAKGIFYFCFVKPGGRTLLDVPEEWQALVRVVRELKALQPMLESGEPAPMPFALAAEGVEGRAWRWKGRDYVVLVNRRDAPAPVPREALASRWRALFEVRRDVGDSLSLKDGVPFLAPYQALVLESRLRFLGKEW